LKPIEGTFDALKWYQWAIKTVCRVKSQVIRFN